MRNPIEIPIKHSHVPAILIGTLIFSFLPIWRVAKIPNRLNLWECLKEITSDRHDASHIPYEQAVEEARTAYQEFGN